MNSLLLLLMLSHLLWTYDAIQLLYLIGLLRFLVAQVLVECGDSVLKVLLEAT